MCQSKKCKRKIKEKKKECSPNRAPLCRIFLQFIFLSPKAVSHKYILWFFHSLYLRLFCQFQYSSFLIITHSAWVTLCNIWHIEAFDNHSLLSQQKLGVLHRQWLSLRPWLLKSEYAVKSPWGAELSSPSWSDIHVRSFTVGRSWALVRFFLEIGIPSTCLANY